jgi:glycosyltransferase involved in cell wall biosynthesis
MDVGLWAADQTAGLSPVLPAETSVQRLMGTEAEALESFGRVDILHDNGIWWRQNHRLARLSQKRGIPRMVSIRGMLEPWAIKHKRIKKAFAWRLYQRRDLAHAQYHHTTSETEYENLKRLGLGVPICMIPNGIDSPDLEEGGCGKANAKGRWRTALFLGRLYPVKGLPNLIEAWKQLKPSGWVLQIAGPDEAGYQAQLEKLVSAAGLNEHISFLGPVDETKKRCVFREAELFVLPSHSESFGMAIAEALAHGLPVLTTTGTPWAKLLEHDCGWWVAPTADAIVAALRDATSRDPDTLHAMGMKGRALVTTEFRWDRVAKQFASAYEELLSSRVKLY